MEEQITRLLIVDDEQEIRNTYSEYFQKRGIDVATASSGEEGLQILRNEVFDVAIVDISMPGGMSGIELARYVDEEGIDTSLIILTGHGDKDDAIAAINVGVEGWFEKSSVKMKDLERAVYEAAQVIPLDEVRRILSTASQAKV